LQKFLQRIASAQAPFTGISCPTKNAFDSSGHGRVRAAEINLTPERKTYAPDQIP
jgi:hypothetical protein